MSMKLPFGRMRVLGPVLFYDLICLARRRRYFFVRTLVPIALFGLFCLVFRVGATSSSQRPAQTNNVEMAMQAEVFFYWFMASQFLLALVLTPAYTAGSIAEEKDRRRVDFLFATDLENQEIILDKFLARVANLLCLLLAGLPILSFAQFWGGVDPELVLLGYGAIALTVISTASFSMYLSVRAHKVRDALQMAYLFLLAYFGLTYFGLALLTWASLANVPLSPGRNPITVGTLIGMLGAGNIFVIQGELSAGLGVGKHLSQMLPSIVFRYALFHGSLAIGCLMAAIVQLRSHALADRRPPAVRAKGRFAPERMLRPGEQPVLWKEFCVDPGLSFNRVGRILVGLIVLGSFGPAVWNLGSVLWQYYFVESPQSAYPGQLTDMLGIAMNAWVRQVGIAVACLTILGVAVRAASSVSGEHEQDTLDSLLASPLETVDILIAKWMGSLWSVRWGALWLCIVWSVGILLGGLNLIILPWLVVAWIVYAAFFASLGLWFSVRTNKTMTAMVWTLGTTAVLSLGQALPWMLVGMPRRYVSEPAAYWLALIQTYGMTPPVAFGWLSFRGLDFSFFTSSEDNAYQILQSIIAGLGVWLVAGLLLLRSANMRFKRSRVIPGRRPAYPSTIPPVKLQGPAHARSGSGYQGLL